MPRPRALRANIDKAFERRFDVCVDFTPPAPAERAAIWRQELGTAGEALGNATVHDVAKRADLSGGSIAAAARIARVLSRSAGREAVGEIDLQRAVRSELLKAGAAMQAARWGKEG